ncbi:MAG: AAA family ATPase [Muribaculaceae bacterium]|nr:AAA family ATPase [Muribaculaceae bacterium]
MESDCHDYDFKPTAEGVERFLSGSRVPGIGPAFARKLVERFGADALQVLADEPARALDIPGLGEAKLKAASEALREAGHSLDLLVFLYSCGLSDVLIDRILAKYKKDAASVVMTDPYSMVEDVWQLSFFMADKIGGALGIPADAPRRLQGALVGAVKHYAEQGHLFATPDQAVGRASEITGVDPEAVRSEIPAVVASGRLVESRGGLYLPVFYNAEKDGARKILELSSKEMPTLDVEAIPGRTLDDQPFSPEQSEAILRTVNSPVMVLTGGPGTGKTTVLSGIISALERQGKRVVLAAPTGRAAKRMTTLTGHEATTIHRLLGYRQGEGYRRRHIEADALIIDEGSMLEQVLFNHLLDAVKPGTQIILVGDVDQLPAIGAGDVLRDMIASGSVPVANLDSNYRQAEGSMIASGSRDIRAGKMPASARDFIIIEENGSGAIRDRILRLVSEELPAERGIAPVDILVVTPQQIGPLGARQLNVDLQRHLNPDGTEILRGATAFRLGDPVMQTANSRERDIYNGEVGRITAVDPESRTLTVTFADGRTSDYGPGELGELTLAYATTVHKLQGSETRYMVFPITMTHKPMLYRNLLYTAVSRATKLCVLVGERAALRYAVTNNPAITRNSNFKHRLRR